MNTFVFIVLWRSPSQAFMFVLLTFMDSDIWVFCLCFRCVGDFYYWAVLLLNILVCNSWVAAFVTHSPKWYNIGWTHTVNMCNCIFLPATENCLFSSLLAAGSFVPVRLKAIKLLCGHSPPWRITSQLFSCSLDLALWFTCLIKTNQMHFSFLIYSNTLSSTCFE
jgi:hypothetical protein